MYWSGSRPVRRRTVRGGRRLPVRRYLSADVTVEGFFDDLNRRGVNYVLLGRFESLPSVESGESLEILVADEDVDAVAELLSFSIAPSRRQKVDLYSVLGLPGFDHRGIPYFTPDLATSLLARATLAGGRYRMPSPQDHFDSLAYRAVYHGGYGTGLPVSTPSDPSPGAMTSERDYASVLSGLAGKLGLSIPLTLEGLDSYLAEKKLRPPLDTLDKLSDQNEWLRTHLEREFGPSDAGLPGLAVFVLRQRAAHLAGMLHDELLREGWEPLETVWLNPAESARVTAAVRGGNWHKGPWEVSGGGPIAYVIAYDLRCSVQAPSTASDVDRVNLSKIAIRRRLVATLPKGTQFNPLHSSDNPRQAVDYIELLQDAAALPRARDQIESIRGRMVFPYPVVELLPSGRRRAVVAVVRHPRHGETICKMFYPSAERFLRREIRARSEFGRLPEVPALLESGPNWLLSPRYGDTRAHVRRSLPGVPRDQLTPQATSRLIRLARALHCSGSFLLDLTPHNLVTDPREGLKVLDWEFLQEFDVDVPELSESPTISGRAVSLPDADVPIGAESGGAGPLTVFHPAITGLPVRVLLSGMFDRSGLLREPGVLVAFFLRLLRRAARMARDGMRDQVRPGASAAARQVLTWSVDGKPAVGRPG
jgi:hypothetical protein